MLMGTYYQYMVLLMHVTVTDGRYEEGWERGVDSNSNTE